MAPKGTPGKVLAALYLLLCVGVAVIAFRGRGEGETGIIVGYAMLLLTFPIGLLIAAVISAIGYMFAERIDTLSAGSFTLDAIYIAIFGVAGYVQWFIAVPWLYRKLKVPSNNSLERP